MNADILKEACSQETQEYNFCRGQLVAMTQTGGKVVPTPYMRQLIVERVHQQLLHPGGERMRKIMSRCFWWPGMGRDIEEYC
jgi:Integrase zinc binding domain